MIKTFALWIIFLIFGRIILGRPLESLTRAVQAVNPDNLGHSEEEQLRVDVKGPSGGLFRRRFDTSIPSNELQVLAEAFNTMIEKLSLNMRARRKAEAEVRESEEE